MAVTYTCIVCPVSCRITVTDEPGQELKIEGYTCKRGLEFAKNEHTNPQRILTTTVKLKSLRLRRLPVISSGEIPKTELRAALKDLYDVEITAPVRAGDVIYKDIRGTGIDVVAARSAD
jgi:CxxC motif-containing protein